MSKFKFLTGRQFGRWFVKGLAPKKKKATYWSCVCACGSQRDVASTSLLSGNSKSCGCLHYEMLRKQRTKYHSCARNKQLYAVWKAMMQRCYNKNIKTYSRYGGRGIFVCKTWHNANSFYRWAMCNGYTAGLTLDRINNNKGYYPSNCRWVSQRTQMCNISKNRYITAGGVTKPLWQWSENVGVKSQTILARLLRGWSPEKAVGLV